MKKAYDMLESKYIFTTLRKLLLFEMDKLDQ